MAAQQTAEQKAAAEKAEAERIEAEKAAEEKRIADEKVAAEKAAAQQAANAPETPQRVVLGTAVVLALKDGGERYLYRHATVGDGYTDAAIEHAESIGLIGVVK